MANIIRTICTEFYHNRPGFVDDVKNWCVFLVHSFNCRSLSKRERKVSQGSVETLFRRGGKRLHSCMANLLRTKHTKVYQNRPGFMEDRTKTF